MDTKGLCFDLDGCPIYSCDFILLGHQFPFHTCKGHIEQIRIIADDSLCDGSGLVYLLKCVKIHFAVRFNMGHFHSMDFTKPIESPDLIDNIILQFIICAVDTSSTESKQIRITRMGTYAYVVLFRQQDGLVHHDRIATMPSARYISRGNIFHNLFVKTHFPCSKAFSQITIQINYLHGRPPRMIYSQSIGRVTEPFSRTPKLPSVPDPGGEPLKDPQDEKKSPFPGEFGLIYRDPF